MIAAPVAGPRRLTLVIPSLRSGGAERSMVSCAGHWARQGRQVTLITSEGPESDFYPVPPDVHRIALGIPIPAEGPGKLRLARHVMMVTVRLRREIRRSRPELVISFMEINNILTLLATRGTGLPLVVMEQTDPRHHSIGAVWEGLRRALYPRARSIVVLTQSVRRWAEEHFPRTLVQVVPNPVDPPLRPSEQPPAELPSGNILVTMGRLVPVKGYDLLLPAAARCFATCPEWSLLILGEGPERDNLQRQAAELGIAGRVFMPGAVMNPNDFLWRSHLFVFSSRYEGLGNALIEAMACGLPVISTDCPSGPGEIVRHDQDGVLVEPESVDALAQAMHRLMGDEAERGRLAAAAPQVLNRFGLVPVMKRWDTVLQEAVDSPSPRP